MCESETERENVCVCERESVNECQSVEESD